MKKDTKHVQLLKRARRRIEKSLDTYICNAITNSCAGVRIEKLELRFFVQRLLNGYPIYEDWMAYHHKELAIVMHSGHYRKARLAWVDWMIEYWSKK